jgi:lipopolysaccharide export system ATP-binding protein
MPADRTMDLLCVKQVSKSYRGRQVVAGVSMHIGGGEIVGLLGPNGAGKTTCFYMIVGLVPCGEGTITLNERDITTWPMHARARAGIGYLPQEASVFRKLTVADNLRAILQTRDDLDKTGQEQRADELLEEFHITHLRDARGMSLSGGERRRVEIARTLAMEPRFVLLDEPFAGVDPLSVIDIQRIIRYLRDKGIGILITDHNVRETLGICERAYIMNNGAILSEGRPEDILADNQVREVYLGADFRL